MLSHTLLCHSKKPRHQKTSILFLGCSSKKKNMKNVIYLYRQSLSQKHLIVKNIYFLLKLYSYPLNSSFLPHRFRPGLSLFL